MYFTTQAKANYYDCDCTNRLKISSAMKYMQQTSSEQLEYLGFSPDKLYSESMVFLLSKMCIKVHRMPLCSEELVVGTAPTIPRGARFVREFIIDSREGERLISALSLWVLVDPGSRKILRPQQFPYPIPFQSSQLTAIIDDIALPKGLKEKAECLTEIPIRYSHIDSNSHVNNTVYADFVCDVLPYEELTFCGLDTLTIGFQNEARWNEVVRVSTQRLAPSEFAVTGLHGGLPCFAALVTLGIGR